jgi:UDPglucose 6-dehydrogenase
VTWASSPYAAVRGADALLLLTEWNEFSQLDFKKIKKLLRHPIIFDGRNMLDPAPLKKQGFKYYGIGRPA